MNFKISIEADYPCTEKIVHPHSIGIPPRTVFFLVAKDGRVIPNSQYQSDLTEPDIFSGFSGS